MKMLLQKKVWSFFFCLLLVRSPLIHAIPCKKGGGWMHLLMLCPIYLKNLLLSWPFLLCITGIHYKCCMNVKTTSVLCGFSLAFCKILVYEPAHSPMNCITSGKLYWWEHYKTVCLFLQKSLHPWKTLQFCFLNNSTWEISWILVWVCTLR